MPNPSTIMADDEARGCPFDTNGDGDCGKPRCPYCGIENERNVVRENRVKYVEQIEEFAYQYGYKPGQLESLSRMLAAWIDS